MFTVIDVTTGEAVCAGEANCPADPVLFDTEAEAMAWTVEQQLNDRDHRIDRV